MSTRLSAHLALGASAIALLVGVELALRCTYPGKLLIDRIVPGIGRMRVPNQKGFETGNEFKGQWVPLSVNAKGLRGEEIPDVKAPGEIRVLCVGDSVVFGGALGDDDTFPAQAQRMCGRPPSEVRFMNGGANGYDTRQSLAFVERYGPDLGADVLVLGWNWNDPISIASDFTFELPSEWLRRSAMYKCWMFYSMSHWLGTTPAQTEWYRNSVLSASTDADSPHRWDLVTRAMRGLVRTSRSQGSKLFVLVMPELTWKTSPEFPALRTLTRILDLLGVPWIDCQPRVYAAFEEGRHVAQNLDPTHPSIEGQGILASVLLEGLWKAGWIPRKP